ncbi:IS30 family transposase [Rhodococcus globerulus]|uniref:IS30 family transposase n=1 Tax=Rhodococcus globerulus TaxID=33008 RepID=UPI00353130FB
MPPPFRLLGIGGGRAISPHRGPARGFRSLPDSGSPWSAGCDESRTSGAEGGPGKRAGSDPGTAPRSDPYITGAHNQSAIGTLVERQRRMVRLLHLPFRDGDSLHAALTARMRDLPAALLRSITWDQGSEMARHTTIARSLGAPVYFCDSRSPWQRGSNENANGLLRDYFPKGTDLAIHSPEHLLAVENELNSRPRVVLQDRCPTELFTALLDSQNPSVLRR